MFYNLAKMRKVVAFFVFMAILVGVNLAQGLSQKESVRAKKQIVKLQKEVLRLKKKLAVTRAKRIKSDILDKLDSYQMQISKLRKQLISKPAVPAGETSFITVEAMPEEIGVSAEVEESVLGGEERKALESYRRLRFEIGSSTGLFGGATILMGEARFPLRLVFGPATTSFRISTGLAQNKEMDRRYVPLNADVIFSLPPGWLSGVGNYLGGGLNYLILTTGGTSGTIGGEVFYGVESDGFGGRVFGEVGYGILRTGFTASHKGTTVMVGYRRKITP